MLADDSPRNWQVNLKPDEEKYIGPIKLKRGTIVTLSCIGNGLFYAGFFDRDEYFKRYGAVNGRFDFPFGTDRKGYTKNMPIMKTDDYYIVLRDGVFSVPVDINVILEVQKLTNNE